VLNAVDLVVPPASMVMLAFAWPTLTFLRGVEWVLKTLTKEDMLGKVVVITGASSAIGEVLHTHTHTALHPLIDRSTVIITSGRRRFI
jgi:hypothetical protein